jgi:hypothetical protein
VAFIADSRPSIRFGIRYRQLSVNRAAIDALGNKPYIQFLWNEGTHTLLLTGLDKKERNSFAVSHHDDDSAWTEWQFHRKAFLDAIVLRMRWDIGVSYKVFGEYAPRIKMIAFRLDNAAIIKDGDGNESNG